MEPIISPWFIYFLGVVDALLIIAQVIAFMFGLATVGFGIASYAARVDNSDMFYGDKEERASKTKQLIKAYHLIAGFFIFSLCVIIFVPSSDTMIKMYVANHLTMNNVNKAIDAGKNVKDILKQDMIDIIREINKQKIEEVK